jgi:hypothetical protein
MLLDQEVPNAVIDEDRHTPVLALSHGAILGWRTAAVQIGQLLGWNRLMATDQLAA